MRFKAGERMGRMVCVCEHIERRVEGGVKGVDEIGNARPNS